jgi:hypothetical protein
MCRSVPPLRRTGAVLTADDPNADNGVVIALGVLLIALGTILFGNFWGVTARLRSIQARFYSGPLWAYRSIGVFGIVGGIVVIAKAVG